MALVTCTECTAEISSEAKTCPKCGAKPVKKTSLTTWIVGIVFLVVMFKSCSAINEKFTTNSAERAAPATLAATAPKLVNWSYTSDTDQMTSKLTKYATLKSINTLSLERPYAGANYGQLIVRKKSGKSEDVMISFDQGQSMCRSYTADCTVSVRFDNAQPVLFSGQTPTDGSSTTVFLYPASKFIAASKKAKTTKVSLEIYQAGNQIFEFTADMPLLWK